MKTSDKKQLTKELSNCLRVSDIPSFWRSHQQFRTYNPQHGESEHLSSFARHFNPLLTCKTLARPLKTSFLKITKGWNFASNLIFCISEQLNPVIRQTPQKSISSIVARWSLDKRPHAQCLSDMQAGMTPTIEKASWTSFKTSWKFSKPSELRDSKWKRARRYS